MSSDGTVKALVCGIAAALITLSMSAGLVAATALDPWKRNPPPARPAGAGLATASHHLWFGQPAPAVLVD